MHIYLVTSNLKLMKMVNSKIKCRIFHFPDNTRYIKDLLDRFEDPRLVPNWSNQGMIILDYLDMITKVCGFFHPIIFDIASTLIYVKFYIIR